MSFTPEQYAEIDQAIDNLKSNPNNVDERLAPFQTDPNFIIHHQFLLSNSNAPFTILYSSKYLDYLLKQENPICTIQLFQEIFDWIPELLQQRLEFIWQLPANYQKIIIPNLVRTCVFIISKLWNDETNLGTLFQHLSEHLPDIDPPHRILRYLFFAYLIREILDNEHFQQLRTKILGDKQDTALFDLFNQIVQTNFSDPSQITTNALQLMLVTLMFYRKETNQSAAKAKTSEQKHEYKCDLPPQFRDLLLDPNFLNTLFSIIPIQQNPEIAKLIMQIVYQMVSIKPDYFGSNENSALFVSTICHNLSELITSEIYRFVLLDLGLTLNQISNQYFGEKGIQGMIQSEIENLIQQVGNIMPALLATPDTFLNENYALVNLMQFWVNITSKFPGFKELISPFFQQYIETLFKASEQDPDALVNDLDLDKAMISEAIAIIPKMFKTDFDVLTAPFDDLSRQVFEAYKQALSSGNGEMYRVLDIKLSWIILLMTSGLRSVATKQSVRKGDTAMPFEVAFLNFIFEVCDFTGENLPMIFTIHSQYYEQNGQSMFGLFVEKALYQFAADFQRSNQGHLKTLKASEKRSPEEIEIVSSAYQKVIRRLVDALLYLHILVDQRILIYQNLKALQNCYCGNESKILKEYDKDQTPIAFAIPVTAEFLGAIANSKFEFVSNPEICIHFAKEITLLMKIARDIVTGQKEAIDTFLQGIEAKFNTLAQAGQDTVAVLVFIYELTGIFSEEEDTSFGQFFQWIFPEKLQILAGISKQIAREPVVSAAYLKLWYKLMKNLFNLQNNPKSSNFIRNEIFPKHSANEIILITMVSDLLLAFFQETAAVEAGPDDIYEKKYKPLKNAMLLMAYSLGSNCIMYEAFDFYEDKTLINLFTAFIAIISNISFEQIHSYPKLDYAYNFLIETLCRNHLMNILQISPEYFHSIFEVVLNGLIEEDSSPSNRYDSKDAYQGPIKSAKYLGEFLFNNKKVVAEAIEPNAPLMEQIVRHGFSLIFKRSASIDVAQMITPYLSFMPGFIEQLGQEMIPQVSEENMAEYTQLIQDLMKVVTEMFIFDNFRQCLLNLSKFADKQKLKIPT